MKKWIEWKSLQLYLNLISFLGNKKQESKDRKKTELTIDENWVMRPHS